MKKNASPQLSTQPSSVLMATPLWPAVCPGSGIIAISTSRWGSRRMLSNPNQLSPPAPCSTQIGFGPHCSGM